ncbi:MAG: hypothetical protein II998_03340 [Clostridia bacterium]|nr:hypothetical protein [Clostridia bacterium]
MNINDIKIPVPFQFTMDDVGWIEGRVPYWDGFQPTRTGIPRRHVLKDYQVVNEIGKLAGMKICGMFVLGDWDKSGILAKVPYSNKFGKEWKGSPYIRESNSVDKSHHECTPEKFEQELYDIRDFLNSATNLEMAYHGLLHECWDDNGEYMSAEFVPPTDFKAGDKSKRGPAPEWYVRAHLDAFLEIYNEWGFKKELRAFTCPGHCLDAWKDGSYTKILKDYGIKYWQEPYITHTIYENDVMLNNMPGWIGFWEAYDINPDKLPTYTEETAGIICTHWPNFLRLDPDLNFENLPKWEAFFNRQADVFGIIISEDIAFAHHQLLFRNNCILEEAEGKIKIDCSKADEIMPADFNAPIYISVKNGTAAFECEGGVMTKYSERKGHTNYKIQRNGKNDIYLKHIDK